MPLNFLVDTGIPIPGPDVQRTTLSLDVTGRFICNTYEKVTTIFLRTPLPPGELNDENFYNRSIETQIDDTGYDFPNRRFRSPLHRTGVIYTFAPAQVRAQKAPGAEGTVSFWNEYRITAQGSRITTWLNGRLVCEGDVPPPHLTAPGFIGLQYHTGKVQFRLIRIRRLQ